MPIPGRNKRVGQESSPLCACLSGKQKIFLEALFSRCLLISSWPDRTHGHPWLPGRLEISAQQLLWEDFNTQLSGGPGGARLLPAQRSHGSAWGEWEGASLGLGESFRNNCNKSQPVPTTVTLY